MSELVWTTEKPTNEGWYWWRPYKRLKPIMSQVYKLNGVLYMKHDDGEWAGPIPEPKEQP